MRLIISLVVVAGFAVASPTPLSPSSRQTAYDLTSDLSEPLDLSELPVLSGGSGLLGANSGIAGLHLARVKRGLFTGPSASDMGEAINSLTKEGGLSDLGLGVGRGGLPSTDGPFGDIIHKMKTCSAGQRYCCKEARRYTDPRNAGLIPGDLLLDGFLNKLLVGSVCKSITGSLAPDSCHDIPLCCTGQSDSKEGPLSVGCTPIELSDIN